MKKLLLSLAVVTCFSQTALADNSLKAAIASDQRTPENVQRDVGRHPYETLSFFGVTPKSHVVELSPGGGWYTEILAPYLRADGKLILAGVSPRLKTKLEAKPAMYDKVVSAAFDPKTKLDYAPKGSVDVVLTFRNVHNWISMNDTAAKEVFKSAYDALKKGGVFGVVEHRLPAATMQDAKASSGYMHEKFVIQLAESVGFTLLEKSEINANPKDTSNYEKGVWTLPPTFANKEVDKAKYEAIGESDRMTLKFVKK